MSSSPTLLEREAPVAEEQWTSTRRLDPVERAQRDLLLAMARVHRDLDRGHVDEITVDLETLAPPSQADLDEAQAFADRFED